MSVYIGNMSNLHPAHRTEDGLHLRPLGGRFKFAHANKFNLITFIVKFVGIRYVSYASRTLFPSSIADNDEAIISADCDQLFLAKSVSTGLTVIFHLAYDIHVPRYPVVGDSVANPTASNARLVAIV